MNRVILVEDHERLAKLIAEQLKLAGVAVDIFVCCENAWTAIQRAPYQALILDRALPDGDGLTLLKRLRNANFSIPCMVLTARDALHDRVEGLNTGADDYLTKPFAMDEMVARVKALLRRPILSIEMEPSHGDLQIKPDASMMRCGNESITLAPAELQIMLVLVRRKGEVARHSALETAGWGLGEAVTPNALDVAICRLRKKIGTIGSNQQIVNLRKLGYALRENKP